MGSGVSKGHSGRRPHFGRSPAGLQIIPAGLRAPQPFGASEGLSEYSFDLFEMPRPWWHLEASRGLFEKPFLERQALERLWGATAGKAPPGAQGRGIIKHLH